jgi:hypothetical protein
MGAPQLRASAATILHRLCSNRACVSTHAGTDTFRIQPACALRVKPQMHSLDTAEDLSRCCVFDRGKRHEKGDECAEKRLLGGISS